MNYEEFKTAFIEWSINNVEPDKGDGWPVCPYARKARLNGEIQFMDGRDLSSTIDVLETFDDHTYNMAVCWMGDECSVDEMRKISEFMESKHPEYYYFVSTETSGNFVQNFTRVLIVQIKADIENRRGKLKKTSYYHSWPQEYYREIVGD